MAHDVFISYSHQGQSQSPMRSAPTSRAPGCAAGSRHAISPRAWTGQPPSRRHRGQPDHGAGLLGQFKYFQRREPGIDPGGQCQPDHHPIQDRRHPPGTGQAILPGTHALAGCDESAHPGTDQHTRQPRESLPEGAGSRQDDRAGVGRHDFRSPGDFGSLTGA